MPDDRARVHGYGRRMVLYTCKLRKKGAAWHPCGIASKALDDAGHRYEIRPVRGYASMPWTWPFRKRDRTIVRKLSGQNGVPILVLEGDDVIAGSARIKQWAAEHPNDRSPTQEKEAPDGQHRDQELRLAR